MPDLTILLTLRVRKGFARADAARRARPDGASRAGVSRPRARAFERSRHPSGSERIRSVGRSCSSTPPEARTTVFARVLRTLHERWPEIFLLSNSPHNAITRHACRRRAELRTGVGWMAGRARACRCHGTVEADQRAHVLAGLSAGSSRDLRRYALRLGAAIARAWKGSSSELHDPHSSFLSPRCSLALGAHVRALCGRRRADRPARRVDHHRRAAARRPGARGGRFASGDRIVKVDGKPIAG